MLEKPKFLQGLFAYGGQGLDRPIPLTPPVNYKVPPDKRTQMIYLRAGNSANELIYLLIMRDGKPMRYFPLGAKASAHFSLAVVEDLLPETEVQVLLAAPLDLQGALVLDIGLVEI